MLEITVKPSNFVDYITFGLPSEAIFFLITYLMVGSILANVGLLKITLSILRTEKLEMREVSITSLLTGLVVWIPFAGAIFCITIIYYRHKTSLLKAIGAWGMSIFLSYVLLLISGLSLTETMYNVTPIVPLV